MTGPMYSNEEYEKVEKFFNRVSVINDVIDSTIEAIGVLAVTVAIVAVVVALKLSGVV